jgi:GNAT superfamily N-acetyltransferase
VSAARPDWTIVELTTEQTHPLRRAVLRNGTPTDDVRFAEDDWPGVIHLGVIDDEVLVGTSTWIPRPFADEPETDAIQLRGMATAHSHQGTGVGEALLRAGCARAVESNAALVWANARDSALGFYTAHGFVVVGEGFIDATTTQLPHHVVARRLI